MAGSAILNEYLLMCRTGLLLAAFGRHIADSAVSIEATSGDIRLLASSMLRALISVSTNERPMKLVHCELKRCVAATQMTHWPKA